MATTHKFRKIVYSSLFGLGLTAGGVTLASAATTQQDPPTTVEAPAANGSADTGSADTEKADAEANEQNEVDEKPNYTSSVTVEVTPEGPEGSDADEDRDSEDRADTAEQVKLEKVAKIDADAASKAATDQVPGTVGEVELDEEAGNVIYEVEVTAKDGIETEVIVDAGNGKILAEEVDDDAAEDAADQTRLEKLAKIDADAASKAATDKVPGTADTPELDDETGQVVYEVEVTAKDGTETEVIVDAVNGKILAEQAD